MRKRAFLVLVLIVGLLSLLWLASSQSTASRSLTKTDPSTAPSMPSKEAVSAKLADLERGWVKNEGQWDQRALFSAPGYFGTTWITKDGELLHVAVKKEECKEKACPSKGWVISERWVGGKVQAIKGEEELETKVSYFIGNDPSKHKSGLSTYRYVSLGEVWSGVEVQLKATQKTVEKLFYVKPGADPSKIVVQVDGAEGLKLSKDGEIIIQTGLGDLKLSKPIAWQEKDGKKLPVEVSYKLIGKNRYSFEVAKADPSLPIVIDPILQSTYLGGRGHDRALALATHPTTGEVYVAGYTFSTNFPNTTGGAQGSKSGIYSWDAFVARLNSSLTQILQSTYLGGRYDDRALALAIHPTTGDVYVTGWTSSDNFPRTTGGAQGSRGGSLDAFVARLNSNLTQILQSTYLGGSGSDSATALAISGGEVYVAGETLSTNFPNTTGGAQGSKSGIYSWDAFVARLNSSLTQILQSTYLGGRYDDRALALAIHPTTGDVYVTGWTSSDNFPRTTGGAQGSRGGSLDAFVARLNSNLTQILQSTYLGGSGTDYACALAISGGEVYVAGWTSSDNFPRTAGGAQGSRGGSSDAFVARLDSSLTSISQSTYLGGSGSDSAIALAISGGDVYVVGYTYSTNFPRATGGAQASYSGRGDAFVARLTADLAAASSYTLSISPTPTNGNVTSSPPGINCSSGGSTCSASFISGSTVTLTATPDSGYTFRGWAGDCSGCGANLTCTITVNSPKTCSVNFTAIEGGGDGGSGGGSGGDSGSNGESGGGGGYYMTGSASSMAGVWNILAWLSVPAFALARRIRRR